MKIFKISELGEKLISLAEIKTYLRLENNVEDSLIEGMIQGAIAYVEGQSGLLLQKGQYRESLVYRRDAEKGMRLVGNPIETLEHIKCNNQIILGKIQEGLLKLDDPMDGDLDVVYIAGYGPEKLPGEIKQALFMTISYFYENRGGGEMTALSQDIRCLLSTYRRLRVK